MSNTAAPAPVRPSDGRVPIGIGVIGHRNVASNDPALRAAVEREIPQYCLAEGLTGWPRGSGNRRAGAKLLRA